MSEYAAEVPAEPVAEVAPVEEAWGGPSQEEWGEVSETMGLLREAINPPQPEQPPYQAPQPQFDGRDPEDFLTVGEAQALLQQFEQSRIAPLSAYAERQTLAEAEERAHDILTDLQGQKGEFIDPNSAGQALARANQLMNETQARYGYGPKAAEAALERAYEEQKAYELAVGKAYHDRQINQIRGLSGAPREPGIGQQQGQHVSIPEGGDEFSLVNSYFQGPR